MSAISTAERTARASIGVCLAVFAIASVAWLVDERTLSGASVWAKPLKFAASLALHTATLIWLVRLVDIRPRSRPILAIALIAAALSSMIEILYIGLQAARGRKSHFNAETAIESVMYYGVMGGAALIIVVSTIAIGVVVLLGAREEIGRGLKLGAACGAILGGLSTLVVAAPLAAGVIDGPGHWVGSPKTDAFGLAILGWSTVTGDLRVPHFFATHLPQALPIVGWIADRMRGDARALVYAGSTVGLTIVGGTFVQALQGRPFVPQDLAVALGLARALAVP